MKHIVNWGLLCSQLVLFTGAEANSEDYNDFAKSSERLSCPMPSDIKNKGGVFISPAGRHGAGWAGVIVDANYDAVVKFEKGVFILTKPGIDQRGFINGCIYETSEGKRLDMRLELGEGSNKLMSVGQSPSWRLSQDFQSPVILECTDAFREACGFYLR